MPVMTAIKKPSFPNDRPLLCHALSGTALLGALALFFITQSATIFAEEIPQESPAPEKSTEPPVKDLLNDNIDAGSYGEVGFLQSEISDYDFTAVQARAGIDILGWRYFALIGGASFVSMGGGVKFSDSSLKKAQYSHFEPFAEFVLLPRFRVSLHGATDWGQGYFKYKDGETEETVHIKLRSRAFTGHVFIKLYYMWGVSLGFGLREYRFTERNGDVPDSTDKSSFFTIGLRGSTL